MAQKQVVVTTNSGAIQAGQDAIIVSRKGGDSVRWESRCDKPCTIVFASNDGSPFKSRVFRLKARGQVTSGALAKRRKRDRGVQVYKYSIMGADANNDPIIIVQD